MSELMPDLKTETTLAQILTETPGEIVELELRLQSDLPLPNLAVKFLHGSLCTATYVRANDSWLLQAFTMDANAYKKPEFNHVEHTSKMLLAMEAALCDL